MTPQHSIMFSPGSPTLAQQLQQHRFRQFASIRHDVDWQRATKNETYVSQQKLDTTPLNVHPNQMGLRQFIEPAKPWNSPGKSKPAWEPVNPFVPSATDGFVPTKLGKIDIQLIVSMLSYPTSYRLGAVCTIRYSSDGSNIYLSHLLQCGIYRLVHGAGLHKVIMHGLQ